MERYIQQLAEDFRDASERVPTTEEVQKKFNIEIPEELEMFAYAELYLRVPSQKLSAILGIDKMMLPPPEKFSHEQTTFLCNEMIQLLNAYHFHPTFPSDLPVELVYRILYDHWDDEYAFTGEGTIHMEFCDYEPSHCPFPEKFCRCKESSESGTGD